jgi:hypothetical protein
MTVIVVTLIGELDLSITTNGLRLPDLIRHRLLSAAFFWMVSILIIQNQDDDDWAF